jgi:hypothetical protein
MSLEGIIIGVLAIGIGAAWATYGLKAFTILLPIWAFFAGLLTGAHWAMTFLGEGFLGTTTSWIIGLVLGIVLAALSYLWYYAAITLLGGIVGYSLGAGIMEALGFEGFLQVVVGVLAGAAVAVLVFVTATPIFLVILLTALGGAAAVVNGVLIFLGRIQVEDLQSGLTQGLLTDGVIGVVAFIVVAALGFLYQVRNVGGSLVNMERAEIDQSSYRM